MRIKPLTSFETAEEARQEAIDWQEWQAYQALSYFEVGEWMAFFEKLGKKFNLTEEFKEEGII